MSLTVDQIVDRAGGVLQDVAHVRWSANDLAKYTSDGQRRVVALIPSAYTETRTVTLTQFTRQAIPAGYFRLLDVVRNNNSGGSAPGRPVYKIPRSTLDVENINWHTRPTAAYVECYVYEPEDDTNAFYVYPKPAGAAQGIDVVLSKDPAELTTGGVLVIDAKYHEALIDYVVMRALTRDSEVSPNAERVNWHAGAFLQGIGYAGKPSAAQ